VQRVSEDLLALVSPRAAWSALEERVPKTAEARRVLLRALGERARGRLVLVTCERFEIYLSGAGLVRSDGDAPFRALAGEAAAERLMRVAAGLESRLLGERQIQRQVRGAFLEAALEGALDPTLHALARAALHAGKRVRSETELGRRGPSLAALTVERLARELTGLRGRTVLILGSGVLATEVARALAATGPARLFVASRDAQRAAALAAPLGAQGIGRDAIQGLLPEIDAVVACTNDVPRLEFRSAPAPLLVDLGAPPNVDAAAARAAGARLIGLAELGAPALEAEIRPAEALVAEELLRFRRWRAARALRSLLPRLAAA
jgi:glutamyl-tRNA reductase